MGEVHGNNADRKTARSKYSFPGLQNSGVKSLQSPIVNHRQITMSNPNPKVNILDKISCAASTCLSVSKRNSPAIFLKVL